MQECMLWKHPANKGLICFHLLCSSMKQGPATDERLPAVWDTMVTTGIIDKNSGSTNGTADMKLDLTQLPLVSTESGEKVCNTTGTQVE
jgi:hypothetical protein